MFGLMAAQGRFRPVPDLVEAWGPFLRLPTVTSHDRQLVADLIAHHPRDADPARLGERFEASRDIDAVAKDVLVLDDDVAEIYSDPELDPAVLGNAGLAIDHSPLPFGGAAHRVDDARELRQQPVASILDDTARMLGDLRVDKLAEMRTQARVGSFLVSPISRE
jgi:hypothetical protein